MQTIRITPEGENNPNPGASPGIGNNASQSNNPAGIAPDAAKTVISEQDALKGVEHTKISTLTPFAPQSGLNGQPGQSVPVGGMVDGKLAVELMDSLLPALFVVLTGKMGLVLKKTDMQMTAKEKETVAPILQKCMDQLMINFNSPWQALAVTVGIIYGGKFLEKAGPGILEGRAKKQKKVEENKVAEVANMNKVNEAVIETKTKESELFVQAQENRLKMKQIEIDTYQPPEDQIRNYMTKQRMGRAAAIERLKNLYAKKVMKQP